MMRTSTGSIRVTKIIQNAVRRNGKRKNTTANADSSEITIFPKAIAQRHPAGDQQHVPDRPGALQSGHQHPPICGQPLIPRQQRQVAAQDRPGILRGSGDGEPDRQREQQHAEHQHGMGNPVRPLTRDGPPTRPPGRCGLRQQAGGIQCLAHALVRRPMKRNCSTVSRITPTISTTDCADDEPRSRFTTPSR